MFCPGFDESEALGFYGRIMAIVRQGIASEKLARSPGMPLTDFQHNLAVVLAFLQQRVCLSRLL
jgi:hypothetical protein